MNFATGVLLPLAVLPALANNGGPKLPEAPPLASFAAAGESPACQELGSKWPSIVGRIEAAFRAGKLADYEAGRRRVEAWLQTHATAGEGCPPWPTAMALQRAMLAEFPSIFSVVHLADLPLPKQVAGRNVAQIVAEHQKLNDEACVRASTQMNVAWQAYLADSPATPKNKRRQRQVTNLQTDASVVQRDGSLGAAGSSTATFVPLAHTQVLASLTPYFDSLQGQGPHDPAAAEAYVAAAGAYAKRQGVDRVVFVNAAGGQVPSFAKQVEGGGAKLAAEAAYVQYDGWLDGALTDPQQVVAFTEKWVQRWVDPRHKTLLVVNCNAGLDRSGTLNALAQLILMSERSLATGVPVAETVAHGFAAIPKVVWQLKQARPHAISTASRYVFLYQTYAAYAESLTAR